MSAGPDRSRTGPWEEEQASSWERQPGRLGQVVRWIRPAVTGTGSACSRTDPIRERGLSGAGCARHCNSGCS